MRKHRSGEVMETTHSSRIRRINLGRQRNARCPCQSASIVYIYIAFFSKLFLLQLRLAKKRTLVKRTGSGKTAGCSPIMAVPSPVSEPEKLWCPFSHHAKEVYGCISAHACTHTHAHMHTPAPNHKKVPKVLVKMCHFVCHVLQHSP